MPSLLFGEHEMNRIILVAATCLALLVGGGSLPAQTGVAEQTETDQFILDTETPATANGAKRSSSAALNGSNETLVCKQMSTKKTCVRSSSPVPTLHQRGPN